MQRNKSVLGKVDVIQRDEPILIIDCKEGGEIYCYRHFGPLEN